MKTMLARTALVALVTLTLAGCGRGTADLETWVAEVKARPAPPLDPLPPLRTFPPAEYTADTLRDPFSAPVGNRDAAEAALEGDLLLTFEPDDAESAAGSRSSMEVVPK